MNESKGRIFRSFLPKDVEKVRFVEHVEQNSENEPGARERAELKNLVSSERYYDIIATEPSVEQLRAMLASLSQTQVKGDAGIGSYNPHTKSWEE